MLTLCLAVLYHFCQHAGHNFYLSFVSHISQADSVSGNSSGQGYRVVKSDAAGLQEYGSVSGLAFVQKEMTELHSTSEEQFTPLSMFLTRVLSSVFYLS